jgi:hypothetical protein
VERATAMLHRIAVMLEIAGERKGWPDRIVGLPDRTWSPRAEVEAAFGEVERRGAVKADPGFAQAWHNLTDLLDDRAAPRKRSSAKNQLLGE